MAWLAILLLPGPFLMADDTLKPFPPAAQGTTRHVLHLPPQPEESLFRVELLVGKTVPVDARNRYFFAGKLVSQELKGWGYTYYQLDKLGPMAGTLIAVDPNEPKVPRFIALGGEPTLLRYNSKLPLVIYVPEGVEVRHRLWSTLAESKPVDQG